MLHRTGLRIREALSLYPKYLDLRGGGVRVLAGEGRRARTVGLDPGAVAIVERWLDARGRIGLNGHHRLFCTLRGEAVEASYVCVMLKRQGKRAGIDKRVHARGSRYTHASQRRAEGVDIAVISKQLGHANISTTARYLDHLAPKAVIETMRSRGRIAGIVEK